MELSPILQEPRPGGWRASLPAWFVFGAALVVAAFSYSQFLPVSHQLWNNPLHDRNAHYWLSLSMGLDLRQGDIVHFVRDLDKTRVWGPLYPLLNGLVLAVGGPDYRLAVLVSLAGWCFSALLAFLVARRLVSRHGNSAGFLAALFVLASPAHQAFANDVMLESLGGGLSLLALYYYLVLVQEARRGAARAFALSLTALFLCKYNYWLLLILALGLAELFTRPRFYLDLLPRISRGIRQRFDIRTEMRNPLSWGVVVSLSLLSLLVTTGGSVVHVAGMRISIRSPDNLLTLAYALAFLRAAQWWVKRGRSLATQLDGRARQLILWHVWPAAVWMLWPKRLGHFLWYLTRDHGEGEAVGGILDGVAYYTGAVASHYHQHLGLFVVVLLLAGVAILCCRRLNVGSGLVVALLLVGGLLTTAHPTCRSRFLHSWIGALWVLAGAGFVTVFQVFDRFPGLSFRRGVLAVVPLALAIGQWRGMSELSHVPEAGVEPGASSSLSLSDQYLGDLAGSDRVAILSNQPMKFFSWWTYLQRYQRDDRVDPDLSRLGSPPEGTPGEVEAWLRDTKCDSIVLVEFDPHSRHAVHQPEERHERLRRCLARQSVFLPVKQLRVPEHDCEIVVLHRDGGGRQLAPLPGGSEVSSSSDENKRR